VGTRIGLGDKEGFLCVTTPETACCQLLGYGHDGSGWSLLFSGRLALIETLFFEYIMGKHTVFIYIFV
jgi:hypothetical protein